jgi:N-succinyldiaminopimelate aminotransferase
MTASQTTYKRGAALPGSNPFQRLADLFDGQTPGFDPIMMTIGEPQHPIPEFTGEVLQENLADFRRYPPIAGTPAFRGAVAGWLDRRYGLDGLIDRDRGVLPLNGSREGLSFGAIAARDQLDKGLDHPAVILPNPFYQTYAAAAHVADGETVLLDAVSEHQFLPDLDGLDPALLDRTVAFYVASPTNPEGSVAALEYWQKLIGLARKHRFMIFADECYSEIYRTTPPRVFWKPRIVWARIFPISLFLTPCRSAPILPGCGADLQPAILFLKKMGKVPRPCSAAGTLARAGRRGPRLSRGSPC